MKCYKPVIFYCISNCCMAVNDAAFCTKLCPELVVTRRHHQTKNNIQVVWPGVPRPAFQFSDWLLRPQQAGDAPVIRNNPTRSEAWLKASLLRLPGSQGFWFNSHPRHAVASFDTRYDAYLCLVEREHAAINVDKISGNNRNLIVVL